MQFNRRQVISSAASLPFGGNLDLSALAAPQALKHLAQQPLSALVDQLHKETTRVNREMRSTFSLLRSVLGGREKGDVSQLAAQASKLVRSYREQVVPIVCEPRFQELRRTVLQMSIEGLGARNLCYLEALKAEGLEESSFRPCLPEIGPAPANPLDFSFQVVVRDRRGIASDRNPHKLVLMPETLKDTATRICVSGAPDGDFMRGLMKRALNMEGFQAGSLSRLIGAVIEAEEKVLSNLSASRRALLDDSGLLDGPVSQIISDVNCIGSLPSLQLPSMTQRDNDRGLSKWILNWNSGARFCPWLDSMDDLPAAMDRVVMMACRLIPLTGKGALEPAERREIKRSVAQAAQQSGCYGDDADRQLWFGDFASRIPVLIDA